MNRKLQCRAAFLAAAAAAVVAIPTHSAHAAALAVRVDSEFWDNGAYTSGGTYYPGYNYSLGYAFTPTAGGTEITAVNVDLQCGREENPALPDLTSANVRIYESNSTIINPATGYPATTELANLVVTSSDPVNSQTTGGGPLPFGSSPTGPVLVYHMHAITPLILYPTANVTYYVATDVPAPYEWYNHTPGTTNPNVVGGGGNQLHTDPTINFIGEVSGRQADSMDPVRDRISGYQAGFYGGQNVNLSVSSVVITTPANINWTDASGNNSFDTSSQNFNNTSGTTVAYSDSSNTLAGTGDNVTFSDSNGGPANYNVSIPSVVHPTSTTISNSAGNYLFNGSGGIAGPGGLIKSGSASLTLGTVNTYTGLTNVSGGTVILSVAGALPSGTNLNIGSGAEVFANNLGTTVPLTVGSLSVLGKLDLNNNALIVHNSSIGAIQALTASGYGGGSWNGTTGIISTAAAGDVAHLTALGVIQNSMNGTPAGTALYSPFEGQTSSSTDVLVKYTYYGDANLDGKVDGTDYSRIDNAFLNNQNTSTPAFTGWYNGDFNYDGVIDGSDYTLIDNAFNSQGSVIAAQIARTTSEIATDTSAVPEPATLSLLGFTTLSLLTRRKRRQYVSGAAT